MTPTRREELETLMTALLEGVITAEEHARLEQYLREDEECRRLYLASMDQHARLLTAPAPAGGKLIPKQAARRLRAWVVPAAAAAIVAVAALAIFREHAPPGAAPVAEQTGNGCAVLAQTLDAVFADGVPPQGGGILKPGTLHLRSGLVRIEFFSGATVLLEGQAELEIVSAWEAACHRGKARVRVPPPAQGFRLQAPGMKLVDLGTEFGLQVDELGSSSVHVFEGEVEAHPQETPMRLLKGGETFQYGARQAGSLPAEFASIEKFDELRASHAQARHDAWWQWFQEVRHDPRLIASYAFKHWKDDRWDRLVNNFTEPRDPSRAGAAVGSRWTEGRWPMKDALEFRGPGDRVRINLGNESYYALTLASWVRVDGLDRKYNALLLTDGYESGEPHWQIYEDGRLMFSIAYADPERPDDLKKKRNQIYYSPSIFNLTNQRRWHHIAVTYDNQTGEAIQYLDGAEISREVSPFHQPGRSISFGPCEIGNWGLPTEGHRFPIRNLNGCMDEMLIYKEALNAADIRKIYRSGRPD